jgi:hypothetical protein
MQLKSEYVKSFQQVIHVSNKVSIMMLDLLERHVELLMERHLMETQVVERQSLLTRLLKLLVRLLVLVQELVIVNGIHLFQLLDPRFVLSMQVYVPKEPLMLMKQFIKRINTAIGPLQHLFIQIVFVRTLWKLPLMVKIQIMLEIQFNITSLKLNKSIEV